MTISVLRSPKHSIPYWRQIFFFKRVKRRKEFNFVEIFLTNRRHLDKETRNRSRQNEEGKGAPQHW